jgi:chemotaxis protein CheD
MASSSLIDIFFSPAVRGGRRQLQIRTMLGSCVSFTLWQPQLRIGAMSHFFAPDA